jgi:hypothetical protein
MYVNFVRAIRRVEQVLNTKIMVRASTHRVVVLPFRKRYRYRSYNVVRTNHVVKIQRIGREHNSERTH